jgi:hypothetical protein
MTTVKEVRESPTEVTVKVELAMLQEPTSGEHVVFAETVKSEGTTIAREVKLLANEESIAKGVEIVRVRFEFS